MNEKNLENFDIICQAATTETCGMFSFGLQLERDNNPNKKAEFGNLEYHLTVHLLEY